MSSIRLSGTTSGHYDLTVPAVAGTNSIDLSNLPVKDSSNNLNITGKLGVGTTTPHGTYLLKVGPVNTTETIAVQSAGGGSETIMQSVSGSDSRIGSSANTPLNLITNNVSRMTIDTSGYVIMPNQPAFGMATTVNGGMVAANTDIILNTGYNGGNHVNTSSGIFTAPVAGRYYFSAWSIKNNSNGTVARLQIRKNGSTVAEARMDESGNYCQAHCSILIDLAANDQIKFRNNDATIFYMGGTYGRCNGYLVG